MTDITLSDGRALTLDLNGHNIEFALTGKCFMLRHGKVDVIGKGKIYEKTPWFAPFTMKGSNDDVADYSVLNVGKDVTLQGWAGIFMDQTTGQNNYGMVANVQGTLIGLKDEPDSYGNAIYVNGSINATEGNVPVINLDGATVEADGLGLYLAGYAKTGIVNTKITATETGVEIRDD